jgi:carbonic anhydrase
MDARIDVFATLGIQLGEAHVIRNAGGRVTDDVLRSLTLSSHLLGVTTVVVVQHTRCGLDGVSEEELRTLTGADCKFLPIADHRASLMEDLERIARVPHLAPIEHLGASSTTSTPALSTRSFDGIVTTSVEQTTGTRR